MVQAPDAVEVLGPGVDTTGAQELATERYRHGVDERMPRDYATMYHPDGTTSVILLPPLGKGGKNIGDRRQKIIHYIMNKRGPKGEQWWFAQPPKGWVAQPLPYRCPVEGCTRAGGLPNLRQVWMHVRHKHPEEALLYKGILSAIEERLQHEVEPDLMKALGLEADTELAPEASETPTEAPPEGAQPESLICECGWRTKAESKNPPASLATHMRLHCPLREVEDASNGDQ